MLTERSQSPPSRTLIFCQSQGHGVRERYGPEKKRRRRRKRGDGWCERRGREGIEKIRETRW